MDRTIRSKLIRKAFALVLALVIGLTFVPLLGSNAYAADEDQTGDIAEAVLNQAENGDAEDVDVYLEKPSMNDAHAIDITNPENLELVKEDAKNAQSFVITDRPTYAGVFEVYSTYLIYAPYNIGWSNRAYDLYMEYSADGGKTWARTGYMRANWIQLATDQRYQINGLLPNHYYVTRIRYGEWDGNQLILGPAVGTGTYKTGPAKAPAVKSITCKAVKVKRHKVRHPAGYYWYGSVLVYQKAWTEKYYTYKVKVTVKLKKKPGTAGLWINGKFCKGNKKKYTATFTPQINYSAKKPKGRKWGVVIASYQNKSYGGYSPLIQKKKKLK